MASGRKNELQEFLKACLGTDWEEQLIIGGAMAGPDATDVQVDLARERAVALVREANPDLTDEQADLVREAWFELWVDVDPSSDPGSLDL
jgi:hypothetical protein